ncbi:MAG: BON domain-containing protein [Chloroflexi bacterium]|nr:MAG: BON domain-containing protein [Chloroflexota bacterium]
MVRCARHHRAVRARLGVSAPSRSRRRPPRTGLADLRPVQRYPGAALGHSAPLRGGVRAVSERRIDYLPEDIREKLIHDPRVAEQDLRVDVTEHRVMLGGNVATPQLRETITDVARELLPGYEIVNETSVVPASEPDGEEPVA